MGVDARTSYGALCSCPLIEVLIRTRLSAYMYLRHALQQHFVLLLVGFRHLPNSRF